MWELDGEGDGEVEQGDQTSQSLKKSILNIHWKDQCCSWSSCTLATFSNEELTHWTRPWCWERLKAKGERGLRGWDDGMASPTLWRLIWANSRRQWSIGKPGVLQSMGSQRVGHNLMTEKQKIKQARTLIPFLILITFLVLNRLLGPESCVKWMVDL